MKPKVYVETSVISYLTARPSCDLLSTYLDLTPDAVNLAGRLIERKAIPKQATEDALHIAVATISGMDYLITWNFKHIANAALRANVELVCRLDGYEPPVICSPMELMEV